jgi:hypothetical protein
VPDAPRRGPRGPPPDWTFGASTYLGIGLAGLVVLAIALWEPLLARVPDAAYVRVGLAVVGGFTAVMGLGRWNVLRHYPDGGRPRPRGVAEQMPSFRSYPPPPRKETASPDLPSLPLRRRSRPASGVIGLVGLVIALLLLSAVPNSLSAASPATPSSSHPAAPVAASGPVPTCTPFYPEYGPVDGLFPPLPLYAQQQPCKMSHDEVHATFSSTGGDSGDDALIPIELPASGGQSPASVYSDVYLGMVVKGDPSSVDGQSYAEIVFTPSAPGSSTTWAVSVAIWSLILGTTCATGLNFSWQNGYGCVVDDAAGASAVFPSSLPGGTWANVTFVGSATSGGAALTLTFNDSTDPSQSFTWTANAGATGSYAFQPYYSVACPDACLLNWSEPFGLGVGIDLCSSPCFSYNASAQSESPPIVVGAPAYWGGLAYSEQYRYVSFESSTGACGGVSTVASCPLPALAGEYPEFTFNGTSLNFGGSYAWTTESFGGAAHEFDAYATSTDFTPMFLTNLTNSSHAGFVAPSAPLNVSVDAQALGTVHNVTLAFELPSGVFGNASMSLVAGAASDGTYNVTVPTLGGNGPITFRAVAVDRAGAIVDTPVIGAPEETVVRGPIPTVSVLIAQSPSSCGGVSINGGAVNANGTTVGLRAGTYPVRTDGCYPYRFSGWSTTGGISVVGGTGASTSVEFHSNGTLDALWRYVVPYDTVTVDLAPSSCADIELNGSFLSSASSIQLLDGGSYPLLQNGCAGLSFGGWTVSNSANLTILGTTLTVDGNGTVIATFVATSGSFAVEFQTNPAWCGGIAINGVGYVSNESIHLLPGTSYPVAAAPCYGWGFAGDALTQGGVSVSAGILRVTAAGSVEFWFYRLTLVTITTDPGACGGVDWDGVFESGGSVLNVTNHTVHSLVAEPCTGYYVQGIGLTGNLTLAGTVVTVDGPGTVAVVFRPGSEQYFVAFITNPATCGSVEFDGTPYSNSQFVDVAPDSVAGVSAIACAGYGFVGWQVSGGVTIGGSLAHVNQSGSIEAIFHPLVAVTIETDPATCGGIELAGLEYTEGETALLPNDDSSPIVAVPCAHDVLEAWQTSGGAVVANGTLALTATSIVLAEFEAAGYDVNITVAPADCGAVTVDGVSYADGTTLVLAAGVYPVSSSGCAGFELLHFSSTGGVNVTGTELAVQGSGNLTAWQGPVPPVLSLAVPSTTGTGGATYFSVSVAVPIPPFNYSYRWSFGDGTSTTTPTNFTSHTYASPGTYKVSVTVTDPYGRTATSSANVTVVVGPGAPSYGIGLTGELVIAAAAIVVAAGAIVAIVRARRSGRTGSGPEGGDASSGGSSP